MICMLSNESFVKPQSSRQQALKIIPHTQEDSFSLWSRTVSWKAAPPCDHCKCCQFCVHRKLESTGSEWSIWSGATIYFLLYYSGRQTPNLMPFTQKKEGEQAAVVMRTSEYVPLHQLEWDRGSMLTRMTWREGQADRCHCLHYREACVDHSSQTLMPSFDALLMARSPSFNEKQGQSRLSCYTVYCVYWMQLYSKFLPMMKSYDCIYSAGMQKQGKGPRTVQ